MAAASTNLCPTASLREILSDPARSTSVSRPRVVVIETVSCAVSRSISNR